MSDVRAFIFGAPLSRAESSRLHAKGGTARRSRTGRRQPVRVVLNSGRASRIEHVSPWADLTTVVDVTYNAMPFPNRIREPRIEGSIASTRPRPIRKSSAVEPRRIAIFQGSRTEKSPRVPFHRVHPSRDPLRGVLVEPY